MRNAAAAKRPSVGIIASVVFPCQAITAVSSSLSRSGDVANCSFVLLVAWGFGRVEHSEGNVGHVRPALGLRERGVSRPGLPFGHAVRRHLEARCHGVGVELGALSCPDEQPGIDEGISHARGT